MPEPSRAVALAQALVRENTVNPPGNEARCADMLQARLEEADFEVARHTYADGRPNLIARIGGTRAGGRPPIGFTGHLDTVPLGAQPWSHDPFGGEIVGGRLYGRGSSDMKGGVAAFVEACLLRREMLANGPGAVLIITSAEETGCEGAFALAAECGSIGPLGALVVAEPTANAPLVGHKGALWLKAQAQGLTAHGSMPEQGVNAVMLAARAIVQLEGFDLNERPHEVLGRATLNVGTFHGGLNINSVPDRAEFALDLRTLPGQSHESIQASIRARLGERISVEPVIDIPAVWTEPSTPWVQDVFSIMETILGETPAVRGAPYFTDAAALQKALGPVRTVILGPGEPHLAHQTDEYCLISRIEQAAYAYTRLIESWCAP